MCCSLTGEACSRMRSFGLSVSSLAAQSATVPTHTPEMNLARSAAMDYFQSLDGPAFELLKGAHLKVLELEWAPFATNAPCRCHPIRVLATPA